MATNELLSTTIDSVDARIARILNSQSNAVSPTSARIHYWLAERQTVSSGFTTLLATAVLPFVLVACSPIAFPALGTQPLRGDLYSEALLATFAEIAAGMAGVLLAAVVFSIQLHAQRDDEGAFMARYLLKKQCIPWSFGYTIGWAGFCVLVCLFAPLRIPYWWDGLLVTYITGFAGLLSVTYWLVTQSIRDATASTFDVGFSLFRCDLARLVAADSYRRELAQEFGKRLEETILEYSLWALQTFQTGVEHGATERDIIPFFFRWSRKATVTDINITCLRELDTLLTKSAGGLQDFRAEIFCGPWTELDEHPVMVLSAKHRDGQRDRQRPSINADHYTEARQPGEVASRLDDAFPPQSHDRIQQLTESLLITKLVDDTLSQEAHDFFERFLVRVKSLARVGDSVLLERLLPRYAKVLDLTAAEFDRFQKMEPICFVPRSGASHPWQSSYWEVVKLGYESGNEKTIEVLIREIVSLYFIGVRRDSLTICQWTLGLLSYAYGRGLENPGAILTDGYLEHQYDALLHSLLSDFDSRRRKVRRGSVDEATQVYKREKWLLDSVLAFVLQLVRYALAHNAVDHACVFIDRLMEYREYDGLGRNRYAAPPQSESVDTIHDYAMIATAGLALQAMDACEADSPQRLSAARLFDEVSKRCVTREELAAVWEFYHSVGAESAVDERFGLSHVDFERDARRVGKIYSGYGDDWLLRGVTALMLVAPQRRVDTRHPFSSEATCEHTWDLPRVETIARIQVTRPELGVADELQETRVEEVMALLRSREQAADRQHLASIADTVPVQEKERQFIEKAVSTWNDKRALIAYFEQNLGNQKNEAIPSPVQLDYVLPLEALTPSGTWITGYGGDAGESLAFYEASQLCGLLSDRVQPSIQCVKLRQVNGMIEDACAILNANGFQPTTILLPGAERFIFALLRRPLWDLWTQRSGVVIGQWNGIDVVEWPYTNPTTIVVLDRSAFFSATQTASATPEHRITLPSAEERSAFRGRILAATGEDLRGLRTALHAKVALRIEPRIGIANLSAAVAIDITRSDGNFAMLEAGEVYHRPWCSMLNNQQDIRLSCLARFASEEDDRPACKRCRPDAWDVEAAMGEDKCLGPA